MKTHVELKLAFHATLTLAALAAAVTTTPAMAQATSDAVPQVEIVAPRLNAQAYCPSVRADLVAALARAAWISRQPAELDVRFDVNGQQVGDVVVHGGSDAYRMATRRAVRALDCDSGSEGTQRIHLQVVLRDL
jgi:hypothetical protein